MKSEMDIKYAGYMTMLREVQKNVPSKHAVYFFFRGATARLGHRPPVVEVSRQHTSRNTHTIRHKHTYTHSVGLFRTNNHLIPEAATFTTNNKPTDENPHPQRDSNPRFQLSRGRRSTPWTSGSQ